MSSPPQKRIRFFTLFLLGMLGFSLFFVVNFKTAVVTGNSMTPTLQDKQKVLTSKAYWLVGRLKVGDIVVIQEEKGSGYFIKRIAGMPGDEIEYSYAPLDWDIKKGKYRVPEGRVHVIGDNINGSDDSRKFGPFDLRRVLGKVLTW